MKKGIIYITLLIGFQSFGQAMLMLGNREELNPVGINFSSIPNLGGTEVTSYGANLNFGIPLKKGLIGLSLGYQNHDFVFSESTNLIDLSSFENIQVIRSNVSYMVPLKDSLNFILSAGTSLMSNFGDGLSSEDFVFNAIIGALKRWGNNERNSALLIGALYGTQFGEPTLLPAISFNQKLNEHWGYSLGLPVTGVNYQINEKHRLSFLVSPHGIFGNNSNEERVEGNRLLSNTKIQFNGINTRISYQFKFTKYLAFFAEGGFILNSVLKILDNDNNEIIDLNPGSGTYFNTGLRLVIKRANNMYLKKKNEN
ncbi:DUF6268 family outer membrane beta-barrel protein [Croceitalea rosinachiae]|uniref:DUF6268 family outer membrane beta-barrel protein n=1 Tax=Croceitalea rosinachiae TaxID=3075596 RepID=A0ABU3A9E3_9FLAO|nr:DUF6268 family outer membrane beta-barrel protein [Croceitalea sp. F388]MDT0606801.1 DUF6268 family outer membrane beta-barrel protein [Croceitalea sp. F388]